MNRRRFLVAIAATAAAGGALALVVTRTRRAASTELGRVRCVDGEDLTIHLDELLPRAGEVRPLGRAVLAAERVRPSRGEIAARLFPDDAWGAACREGARPVLLDRIRGDFRDDRTVAVQGWVLSRTEADLYALAELVLSAS